MFANPNHSRVVLINPSRSELGEMPAEIAARRHDSQALLSAVLRIVPVAMNVIGEYQPARLPERFNEVVTLIEADGLSLWNQKPFTNSLVASDVVVILLGGAWLEEDALIAALEGVKLGYDVRLLADLSVARIEADRALVLDRLALHGIPAMTVRQAVLEWATWLEDPILKQRVQQLLA
jgi:hypothetical protein